MIKNIIDSGKTLILPSLLLLVACDQSGRENAGLGGLAAGVELSPMSVVSTTPEDLSVNVAVDSTFMATFDEDLFGPSVTDASFHLERNGFTETGTVESTDARTVSLSPLKNLALETHYFGVITNDLTDSEGRIFDGPYEWAFSTAEGSWEDPGELLVTDSAYVTPHADSQGNTWLFYYEYNPFIDDFDLLVSLVTNGETLSSPITVNNESDSLGADLLNPQIINLPDGDIFIVWKGLAGAGEPTQLMFNRYDHETQSWGIASAVMTSDLSTYSHALAHVGESKIALMYVTNVPGDDLLSVRFYDLETATWEDEQLIDTEGYNVSYPRLTGSENGSLMVSWRDIDQALSSYFNTDTQTWSGPMELHNPDAGSISGPVNLVSDGDNHFIAVWSQEHPTLSFQAVYTNRFAPLEGWDDPSIIPGSIYSLAPQVVADIYGNVHVLWTRAQSGFPIDILYNQFEKSSNSWGDAFFLEDRETNALFAGIDIDESGNVLIHWNQQLEGLYTGPGGDLFINPESMLSRKYSNLSQTWNDAVVMNAIGDDVELSNARVSFNDRGEALFLWASEGFSINTSVYQSRLYR